MPKKENPKNKSLADYFRGLFSLCSSDKTVEADEPFDEGEEEE